MRDIRETKMIVGEGKVPVGFPYPWPSMNEVSRGIQPGEVVVVLGRPGDMKTWTLCAFAAAQCFCGTQKRVLVRSFDTPRGVLMGRVASLLSGMPYQEFRRAPAGSVVVRDSMANITFSGETPDDSDIFMQEVSAVRPGLLLLDGMPWGDARDPLSLSRAVNQFRALVQKMDMAVVVTVQSSRAFAVPAQPLEGAMSLACDADVLIRQRPCLIGETKRLVVQVLKAREWEAISLVSEIPPSGTFRELRTIDQDVADTWLAFGGETKTLADIQRVLKEE